MSDKSTDVLGRGAQSSVSRGLHDPDWNFDLSARGATNDPLHRIVMKAIISRIEDHDIPAGVKVPSSRTLSNILGVGRNTVISAIDGLVEQGYLVAKDRSGVRVANIERPVRGSTPPLEDRGEKLTTSQLDATGTGNLSPTETANEAFEDRYSFIYGQFDRSLFPIDKWRECERAALGVLEIGRWGRDMVDEDDGELVKQLRTHVLPYHGIWAKSDEILVTLGGQEGRYLCAQLLCRNGIRVGLENPGMPDMHRIVSLVGATQVLLEVDHDGLIPSSTVNGCDVVFSTVGNQCPTAVGMPSDRRLELLRDAHDHNFIIVEDTFETESLTESHKPMSLKGIDDRGRVIYIGSLSKLLAPGLRVGVVVAPAEIIQKLREIRRLIHRHPPGNTQQALAIFIERGYYRTYLRRVARELDARSAVLATELRRRLPDFTWSHQAGTASFWIRMPERVNAQRLAQAAKLKGVLVEPGNTFFHQKPCPANFLRLAVSSISEEGIAKGIGILADLVPLATE
jgi:GntR family transcriptional regulator/MocR family aminotransferase